MDIESKPKVVFVTDRSKLHQQAALAAAPSKAEVIMLRRPDRPTLRRHLATADILVSERQGTVDGDAMASAPRLRLIQRLGSFVHDIDLEAARSRNIAVCRQPIRSCMAVAEHALLLTLALCKQLPEVTAIALEAGDWRPVRQTDEDTFAFNWSRRKHLRFLFGQRVGILGFGEIGAELARRLQGFAPERVYYHKRQRLPASVEADFNITYAEADALLKSSQILIVLLPYHPETEHYLNEQTLTTLPRGAVLVGCGSGRVIDEAALARALESGHLAGAALDTFEWEPLTSDNPLLPLARDPHQNVILTPHTAAGTLELAQEERQEDWENVRRLLQDRPLLYRVV
ncbi:NAD(P)-dependent oxidoreductase [Methylohalobius crimeensis]|uniref:NAD(P)-dependent oxidoreductase n=1 Tax=Methylohalobius crimeensis TaxID=244365 RepID=UPI0003B52512|nr:NAD(P)-dependent oxidoreductase [Methylohalobius crimeensis]